jgi:hypothetical protein
MSFLSPLRTALPAFAALAIAFVVLISARPAPTANAIGAELVLPSAACSGSAADVTFKWKPQVGGSQQWVDISLHDNGFEAGTFIGAGAFGSGHDSYTWTGITKGLVHYWRVNTLTAAGWIVSETGRFVPCGGPVLLWGPIECTSTQSATAHFRWAPGTPWAQFQFLDLGTDSNFAPGSFTSSAPMTSEVRNYDWVALQSNVTYHFRVNALGQDNVWRPTIVGSFVPQCAAPVLGQLYGSSDRLVATRLGINAPVNVRDVGPDGVMGDPAGPTDVVRYNFGLFPGLGGQAGFGGTIAISGHVDYRNYGLAVFAPLRNVQVGDVFEYYRGDGTKVTYVVDWFSDLPPNYDWGLLVISSNPESLLLITCNGTFNTATREYDHRRAVHAVIQQ